MANKGIKMINIGSSGKQVIIKIRAVYLDQQQF